MARIKTERLLNDCIKISNEISQLKSKISTLEIPELVSGGCDVEYLDKYLEAVDKKTDLENKKLYNEELLKKQTETLKPIFDLINNAPIYVNIISGHNYKRLSFQMVNEKIEWQEVR